MNCVGHRKYAVSSSIITIKGTTLLTSQANLRIRRGASEPLCGPLRPPRHYTKHRVVRVVETWQLNESPSFVSTSTPVNKTGISAIILSCVAPRRKFSWEACLGTARLQSSSSIDWIFTEHSRSDQFASLETGVLYCVSFWVILGRSSPRSYHPFLYILRPRIRRTRVKQMKWGTDGIALYLSPNCFSVDLPQYPWCCLFLAIFYSFLWKVAQSVGNKQTRECVERAFTDVSGNLDSRSIIQMCDWFTCVLTFLHQSFCFSLLNEWLV